MARTVAHIINDKARSRAIRDLIEWYPEEYEELRSNYIAKFREELGYQDARIVKGATPGIANKVLDKARSATLKDLTSRYRLEFDLLRDAYRRELQKEAGFEDGRKKPRKRRDA